MEGTWGLKSPFGKSYLWSGVAWPDRHINTEPRWEVGTAELVLAVTPVLNG